MKTLLLAALLLSSVSIAADPRIKVAVVDTGILISKEIAPYICTDGHKDHTRTDLMDRHGHGTNVAHLIAQSLDPTRHCLVIIKWLDSSTPDILAAFYLQQAIYYAAHSDVKYINVSAGGQANFARERKSIEYAVKRGIRVVVASGNDHANLDIDCIYFPACYSIMNSNFYVVGALDKDGKRAWFSNYGGPINAFAPGVNQSWKTEIIMSGTSQATAVYTGWLAARENK